MNGHKLLIGNIEMKDLIKLSLLFSIMINFQAHSSEWSYNERIDSMTDKNTSYAKGIQLNCSKSCGAIVVRADGEVIISFDNFMTSNEDIRLDYRFNKEDMNSMNLLVSTEGTSGFIKSNNIELFVAKLMSYNFITLRGYDFRGTAHTFKISLSNSATNILKLAAFSNIKSLDEFKEEKALALEALIKKVNIPPPPSKKDLKALANSLYLIEEVSGRYSEAYKIVKKQYEIMKEKINAVH